MPEQQDVELVMPIKQHVRLATKEQEILTIQQQLHALSVLEIVQNVQVLQLELHQLKYVHKPKMVIMLTLIKLFKNVLILLPNVNGMLLLLLQQWKLPLLQLDTLSRQVSFQLLLFVQKENQVLQMRQQLLMVLPYVQSNAHQIVLAALQHLLVNATNVKMTIILLIQLKLIQLNIA
jgi:hypothetical protein